MIPGSQEGVADDNHVSLDQLDGPQCVGQPDRPISARCRLLQHCQRSSAKPALLERRYDVGAIGGQYGDGTATAQPPRSETTSYPFGSLVDVLPGEPNRVGEGGTAECPGAA